MKSRIHQLTSRTWLPYLWATLAIALIVMGASALSI